MPVKASPRFAKLMSDTDQGMVLRPILESYLSQGKFADRFSVSFEKTSDRKPDDWFHPSTHPLWPERLLYYYLSEPDRLSPEQLDYASRMSVTMGTAVHGFIETCVHHAGLMVPREGNCPACERPYGSKKGECAEYGAADLTTGSRGHMDGVIKLSRDGKYWDGSQPGVFELKSVNEMKARFKLQQDLRIDTIREVAPEYYAQVQEYMRMTGLRQAIILFVTLGYPWDIYEYQIPYNEPYALKTAEKYLYVRDLVSSGMKSADPCCGGKLPKGRECPARFICGVSK